MYYTDARRRNSLNQSEEQTGQDRSVDEADVDLADPTELWLSIRVQRSSRIFTSLQPNESSVSLPAQKETA